MAENKKSFILYADMASVFEKLPDEVAGKLIKIIFDYVNDKNPEVNDLLLQIAFEPIKLQLKRDLKSWEVFREKQSENGKLGGRPKKDKPILENPKNPSLLNKSQKSLNVNVNDNVNVNVKDINKREQNFKIELSKYEIEYGNKTIEDFYNYWTEKNGTRTKMLFEMQKTWDTKKRLARWSSHSFGKIIPTKFERIDKFDQLLKDLTNA